eukprot:scaffold4607_cov85-Isochrysis_galbana.AAC.2
MNSASQSPLAPLFPPHLPPRPRAGHTSARASRTSPCMTSCVTSLCWTKSTQNTASRSAWVASGQESPARLGMRRHMEHPVTPGRWESAVRFYFLPRSTRPDRAINRGGPRRTLPSRTTVPPAATPSRPHMTAPRVARGFPQPEQLRKCGRVPCTSTFELFQAAVLRAAVLGLNVVCRAEFEITLGEPIPPVEGMNEERTHTLRGAPQAAASQGTSPQAAPPQGTLPPPHFPRDVSPAWRRDGLTLRSSYPCVSHTPF